MATAIVDSELTTVSEKKHEPYIETLLIIQAVLAIGHFLGDVIVEVLSVTHVIHEAPIRISFIFLSFMTGFLAYKTFDAIKVDQYAVAHEDVQAGWLMEFWLLGADLWFLYYDDNHDEAFIHRIFFMIANVINLSIMTFIMCKYRLWSIRYKGPI